MFYQYARPVVITLGLFALSLSRVNAQGSGSAAPQQYSIMIWETPGQLSLRTDSVSGTTYWNAFTTFGAELQKAGILRGGTALRTGSAVRTVTVRGGKQRVVNTPYIQSREELGGYFIIEVASLNDAVRWAARLPSALTGAVEVRPAYPAPTMMK